MKLHASAVDKLLYLCQNYGGHASERKLMTFIEELRFSPYVRTQADGIVLVETDQYVTERLARRLPTHDIVPMKLHASAVKKIMDTYDMYGGHENETKLKWSLNHMDFTPYERQLTHGDTVLVITEDYIQVLRAAK